MSSVLYFIKGCVLEKLGRYGNALTAFEKVHVLNSDHVEAWYCRGVILKILGRYEEALSAYEQALTLRADHIGAWNNKGTVLGKLDRLEEALTAYDQTLNLKPDQPEVLANKAVVLSGLGRNEEALVAAEKSIALKPDYPEAWCAKGVAIGVDNYEEANIAYEKALTLKPDFQEAAHLKKSLEEAALPASEQAVSIKPEEEEEAKSNPMADPSSEHVVAAKRLRQSAAAAALVMEKNLSETYVTLRLGRGFFRRKMPDQVKAQTASEMWGYLSALLVIIAETWPVRPPLSDLEGIIRALESALFDAKEFNFRPEYEAYRLRFREGRSMSGVPDSKIFGPLSGLHSEFSVRLVLMWDVPSVPTGSLYVSRRTLRKADQISSFFTMAMADLTQKIEEILKKSVEELWPVRSQ
ncbi:tetratricopeptide repeat protein [Nitrospira defluvii]|nr:tetratricopeptide repeat protein [Nitrospira defluvii]